MYRMLCNINNSIYKVLKILIIVLLCVMSVLVFNQVIFRYVLHKPIAWSEELSTYCFSWLAYFGAAAVLKNNGLISIDSVVNSIKNKKIQKGIKIFREILLIVFLIVVVKLASSLTATIWVNDQRLTNIVFMKLGIIFLQVPLSFAFMLMFNIEKIVSIIKEKSSEDDNVMEGSGE